MPSSQQTWAHATNSSSKLQDALVDPNVTAIEADLLMGRDESVHAWTEEQQQQAAGRDNDRADPVAPTGAR